MAKILLVDDDLQLTIMLKLLLEGEKYDVQVCNLGGEALQALKTQSFDLIVLDWELPDSSGPEICRQFRQQGGTKPVLMLTAKSETAAKLVGFDAGADDYLVKPFDPPELFARLKAILKRSALASPQKAITPQPSPMDIDAALQDLANRYAGAKKIGSGAMGLVFKALDKALNRPVVVKMLHPELVPDAQSLARFRLEAQAIAQLSHPNIVTIHDFGVTPNGLPYLVMEFLNGSALDAVLLREHQIHPRDAIKIFKQVCDGLQHAHDKGIVHRDLKPSNLMFHMIEPGVYLLKLLDFGIAKCLKNQTGQSQTLTRAGEIYGTPLYMSPEQALGFQVDWRSDIFSLGYVFYECVTGIKLFYGDNELDCMHRRTVEEPIPFAVARPDLNLPQSLEMVIFKALSVQPNRRYQTASEFKSALDSIRDI